MFNRIVLFILALFAMSLLVTAVPVNEAIPARELKQAKMKRGDATPVRRDDGHQPSQKYVSGLLLLDFRTDFFSSSLQTPDQVGRHLVGTLTE
jgi:hypothetical protein